MRLRKVACVWFEAGVELAQTFPPGLRLLTPPHHNMQFLPSEPSLVLRPPICLATPSGSSSRPPSVTGYRDRSSYERKIVNGRTFSSEECSKTSPDAASCHRLTDTYKGVSGSAWRQFESRGARGRSRRVEEWQPADIPNKKKRKKKKEVII